MGKVDASRHAIYNPTQKLLVCHGRPRQTKYPFKVGSAAIFNCLKERSKRYLGVALEPAGPILLSHGRAYSIVEMPDQRWVLIIGFGIEADDTVVDENRFCRADSGIEMGAGRRKMESLSESPFCALMV